MSVLEGLIIRPLLNSLAIVSVQLNGERQKLKQQVKQKPIYTARIKA